MRDFVLVKIGEEIPYILKAKELGYQELVLCYTLLESKLLTAENKKSLIESTTIKLFFGLIQESTGNNRLLQKNSTFNMLIGLGTISDSISGGLTHIYNNEFGKEKDGIHQRRSGLNHVILAEMKKKNVEILFSLSDFNGLNNGKNIILGRAYQNVKACRRAGVKYSVVSMARDVNDMKSASDLNAFREVLNLKI